MKIAVGGMVASGKSTLVNSLSKATGFPAMPEFEPDDIVFNTILQWLYDGVKDVDMLLQVYFLHKHWATQKEYTGDVIVDKHIIENLIFAQENLKEQPELLNIYVGLFNQYVSSVIKPDLYIILDMSWDTFKQRLMHRGRAQEVDNFDVNEPYFLTLKKDYVSKLVQQCVLYDIPYIIINTDGMTEEEVLKESLKVIANKQN